MSKCATSCVREAVQRLGRGDSTLEDIYLYGKRHTDSVLAELVECLLARPNAVKHVTLRNTQLTDETGIKLARYVASSSTIQMFNLPFNQIGEETHLALAAALRVNSSLRHLSLYYNQAVDPTRVEAAFVEALRLNPYRPVHSVWWFSLDNHSTFQQLKHIATVLGPPSMLSQLRHCDRMRDR